MYSIFSYAAMIADNVRMTAFRKALAASVKPGSVVLDIGAGQGIFSLIACELGAARVYAVEPSDVIAVARECARVNGFADRIQFFQEVSQKIGLPEKVDVIVSDMRGVLPIYGKHFEAIIDARNRFLKPGGTLIPTADLVSICLVDARKEREQLLKGYSREIAGFDFTPALNVATNEFWKVEATPEQMMSDARRLFNLDYAGLRSPDLHGNVSLRPSRNGRVDGTLLWFETELQAGVGYSTGPMCPTTIYGQGVLPWPEPINLLAGDMVDLVINVKQIDDEPFWRWQTKITREGKLIREMDQSLLPALMLSKDRLHKTVVS
jgi:type I protein arginine methyltransferase